MKNKSGIMLFALVVLIGATLTGCISEDESEELNLERQAMQAVETSKR